MAFSCYKKSVIMALLCTISASSSYSNTTKSLFSVLRLPKTELSSSCKNLLTGAAILGLVTAGSYYLWNWYTRSAQARPFKWQHPCNFRGKECPTKAIFAPALFQSEITTTYYTGAYTASTGEKFICTEPFTVLQPEHTVSCNFCEISPIKNNRVH